MNGTFLDITSLLRAWKYSGVTPWRAVDQLVLPKTTCTPPRIAGGAAWTLATDRRELVIIEIRRGTGPPHVGRPSPMGTVARGDVRDRKHPSMLRFLA